MAHKDLYSDIWRRSVYEVVWFERPHEISSKGSVTDRLSDPGVNHHEDIESSSVPKQFYPIPDVIENIPTLPKATNSVRRGIDAPFSRQQTGTYSNRSSPTISSLGLPSYPNKSAKSEVGSRFIETFRESTLLTRPDSLELFVANYQVHKDPFTTSVVDVDAPIPIPRLSEWVRADALKGISVHTNPHISVEIHKDQTKNTT